MGIKPVRGGRPPSDKRIKHVRAASAGVLVQVEASVMVLVELILFNVRKAADVITIYVASARRVILGAI